MIPSAFEGLARHEHSEELWKLLDYLSVRYKVVNALCSGGNANCLIFSLLFDKVSLSSQSDGGRGNRRNAKGA